MRKLNLKKGDIVILAIEEYSNLSRGMDLSLDNIDNWTFKAEVISAGRKYVTVKPDNFLKEMKFEVENDYREKYTYGTANYKLYRTMEEVIEERKQKKLFLDICNIFTYGNSKNISLKTLEKIKEMIESDRS